MNELSREELLALLAKIGSTLISTHHFPTCFFDGEAELTQREYDFLTSLDLGASDGLCLTSHHFRRLLGQIQAF